MWPLPASRPEPQYLPRRNRTLRAACRWSLAALALLCSFRLGHRSRTSSTSRSTQFIDAFIDDAPIHPVGRRSRVALAAEAVISPFAERDYSAPIETLELTLDNIETVLEELRPHLQRDGGDVEVADLDGPMLKLRLLGSCSGCSSSAITMKKGIEARLKQKIPDIYDIQSVMPDQEPLTEENIEEVLDGIRPFLSASGGGVELYDFEDDDTPFIAIEMSGPAAQNNAMRMEITKRIRKVFPLVHDVEIREEGGFEDE